MMFKSWSELPPGGWKLRIAQMGDNGVAPFGMTFTETAEWGKNLANANPRFNLPSDYESWAREVALQTYNDLKSRFPNEIGKWIAEDSPSPKWSAQTQGAPYKSPWGANVAAVKKISAGVGLMLHWLGDGLRPVEQDVAEKRAAICAVCPQNQSEEGFFASLTEVAMGEVKRLIEVRNEMKLVTSQDDKLKACHACGCVLRLKVFANLDHILAHTTPEVMAKLDPSCWITKS